MRVVEYEINRGIKGDGDKKGNEGNKENVRV